MSVRTTLGVAIAASTVVMLVVARPSSQPQAAHAAAKRPEKPWLSPEAAAQIVGADGRLGPLFEGVMLGGPAPAAAVRARIAEFARANRVAIDLEVVDGELVAVHFDVTFGGCCGYEGADVLALRLGRPTTSECCGCTKTWIDDWAIANEDGVTMRARVRVNRVSARWESTLSLAELVERADALVGVDAGAARKAARDRWTDVESQHFIEVPYPLDRYDFSDGPFDPKTAGVRVVIERGQIAKAAIAFAYLDYDQEQKLRATLRSRWGTPRVTKGLWTWRTADRVMTADAGGVTIARRD